MNSIEDARASLDEIAKRRNQVIDGAARGRHRGWQAAGMLATVAGFATLDLPVTSALRLTLAGVAAVAALTCFTMAERRGQAVIHRSQRTARFWAVLGGLAIAAGALTVGGLRLMDWLDAPLFNTIMGVVLVAVIAAVEPVYRALLRRTPA